jgi:hypothetical protein
LAAARYSDRDGAVVVNRSGEDIEPLLANADKTVVTNTTWGDLDAEIAAAQKTPASS